MSLVKWFKSLSRLPGQPRPAVQRPRPARCRLRLEPLEDRLVPSTLTVNTALDEVVPGDGLLSLREAISAATPSGDTINFDQGLNGQTIKLVLGELLINKNLNIVGLGASNLAVSGQNLSRVFEIAAGATDTISGLTITKGNAFVGGGIFSSGTLTVSYSTLTGNSAAFGGGIYMPGGTVAVSHSTLSGNSAQGGGGIENFGGTLTVSDSTLSGNSATVYGSGGIANYGTATVFGTATIRDSTLTGNTAAREGGGIGNYAGTLNVTHSTLSGNSAGAGNLGGGIFNGATATVSYSILSGNSANLGGGIFNSGTLNVDWTGLGFNTATYGGGIHNDAGATAVVSNSVITRNTATIEGGGIDNFGTLTLDTDYVCNNIAPGGADLANHGVARLHNSNVCVIYNTGVLLYV